MGVTVLRDRRHDHQTGVWVALDLAYLMLRMDDACAQPYLMLRMDDACAQPCRSTDLVMTIAQESG